ncbi:hypothetical protein [Deinococcus navajonensis]|uniref:Uncharacterized protein n=1 Tax=Deinococcus navajonensis TaxID=309884 RepID=A0ABV8XJC0_9DEIO
MPHAAFPFVLGRGIEGDKDIPLHGPLHQHHVGDLLVKVQANYATTNVEEDRTQPAGLNPISLVIQQTVIRSSQRTGDLARQMGTARRSTDPFSRTTA